MIKIEVNNFKCRLVGDIKIIMQLRKDFALKNPNAFFIRRSGSVDSSWDGNINYITEANYFKTGLLPQVVKTLKEKYNQEVKLVDYRNIQEIKIKIPKRIGNLDARDIQTDAIEAVVNNKLEGMPFPVGVLDCATNSGKTAIMVGIYLAYKKKLKALVLLKDGELFNQFLHEMPLLVGVEDFGHVRAQVVNWNNFTIAMVQTLYANIAKHSRQLANYDMVLVDEADEGESKSYRTILQQCRNAYVKVGLSGTIFMSNLSKHKIKNQNLHSFFGDTLYKVTKRQNMDKGYSTEIVVNMCLGNDDPNIYNGRDYQEAYDKIIIYNYKFIERAMRRVRINLLAGRKPMIILCKFHKQVDIITLATKNKFKNKGLVIKSCHHKTKDKTQILNDFKGGKIDILITTYIVKRGKNYPLLKYICNVSGGDSMETVSQIMGRLERTHETKKVAYLDDFYHYGKYVERHSKHRLAQMKSEQIKVKLRYTK